MKSLEVRLKEYFLRYAESLGSYDADATAALWGEPGMVVADTFVGALATRREMAVALGNAHQNYHKLGLGRAEPELGDLERITDRIVRVAVRWTFFDRADAELTDCTYVYVLRDDGVDLRIHVAISVDEPEKMRALAAAKGIPL